jgi:hypothetical protein
MKSREIHWNESKTATISTSGSVSVSERVRDGMERADGVQYDESPYRRERRNSLS